MKEDQLCSFRKTDSATLLVSLTLEIFMGVVGRQNDSKGSILPYFPGSSVVASIF
jgi:hypothetical protein